MLNSHVLNRRLLAPVNWRVVSENYSRIWWKSSENSYRTYGKMLNFYLELTFQLWIQFAKHTIIDTTNYSTISSNWFAYIFTWSTNYLVNYKLIAHIGLKLSTSEKNIVSHFSSLANLLVCLISAPTAQTHTQVQAHSRRKWRSWSPQFVGDISYL